MKRSRCVAVVVVAVVGAMLLLTCCFFNLILDAFMHLKMEQMLALKPSAFSFDYWKNPPVPLNFQLFMFDIVNPDEVRKGAAPTLVEKGPYTYVVSLEKLNITFNDNHTVSYRQRQIFVFDREQSVGWDTDTFTTVNAPLFTVAALLQYEFPFLQEAANLLLEGLEEDAFITVSVNDIFWGYEDRFLELLKKVMDKLHLKSKLVTGIFGYYMGKNDTDDGLFTVHTGTDDLAKFLIIDRWNGLEHLDYWSTPLANMINGTDGSLYPPFVTTDRVLQMYDTNILRSMNMLYKGSADVRGIPTMKFVVEDQEFANATVNPWNAGFCTPLHNCIPSGLINCSAMGHGAPLYVSLPHFLGADPYYFNLVNGMHPDREKHQPFFDLHQLTGLCLHAARRYQLNIQIKDYPFLTKTHGLSLAYVPVMWINGVAMIDDSLANMIKRRIEIPLTIVKDMRYVLFAISSVMVLVSAIILIRHWYMSKETTSQNGLSVNKPPVDNENADERTHLIPSGS